MRTLTFKAQLSATVNQVFGDSSPRPTTADRAVIKSFSTVQTTKQSSEIVGQWEEPPNILFPARYLLGQGNWMRTPSPQILQVPLEDRAVYA